jgi:putative NADPH-quinone reductase
MRILVILAHPDVENGSIGNKTIINEVKKLKHVEIRDLYQMYPDFKIDVGAEQTALINADLIIFQFPFYWYSVPGLLKEWMDVVLLYGFAYGSTGDKLHGKECLISTTIGGPADSYQEDGYNSFTIPELLKPLEQTANLTGMKFNTPLTSHDVVNIPGLDVDKEEVEKIARDHASRLLQFINEKISQ